MTSRYFVKEPCEVNDNLVVTYKGSNWVKEGSAKLGSFCVVYEGEDFELAKLIGTHLGEGTILSEYHYGPKGAQVGHLKYAQDKWKSSGFRGMSVKNPIDSLVENNAIFNSYAGGLGMRVRMSLTELVGHMSAREVEFLNSLKPEVSRAA